MFSVDSHVELVHLTLRGCDGLPMPDSIIGSMDFKTFELVVYAPFFQVSAFQLLSVVIFIPSLKVFNFVPEVTVLVHVDPVSFGHHERGDVVCGHSKCLQIFTVVPTSDWVVRVPVSSRIYRGSLQI